MPGDREYIAPGQSFSVFFTVTARFWERLPL